jgi:hypothetical protein
VLLSVVFLVGASLSRSTAKTMVSSHRKSKRRYLSCTDSPTSTNGPGNLASRVFPCSVAAGPLIAYGRADCKSLADIPTTWLWKTSAFRCSDLPPPCPLESVLLFHLGTVGYPRGIAPSGRFSHACLAYMSSIVRPSRRAVRCWLSLYQPGMLPHSPACDQAMSCCDASRARRLSPDSPKGTETIPQCSLRPCLDPSC